MKTAYILLSVMLSLHFLTSCEDNDNTDGGRENLLHLSSLIKGLSPYDSESHFEGGNDIGLYIASKDVTGQLNTADIAVNTRFAQSAGGLVSQEPTYWNGKSQLTVYGYYPYNRELNTDPETYPFEINQRQDTILAASQEYKKNDFLWTRQTIEASTKPALLTFQHLMSKIVLQVKNESPTPGNMIGSNISICNISTSASIDLGTGTVTPSQNKGNVTAATLEKTPDEYETVAEAIVIPQTISVGTRLLDILTLGNYSHYWDTDKEIKLEPGKQITLEVVVKENECVVHIKEITDWKDNNSVIIGQAIEDLPTFKLFDFYNRKGIQGIVIDVDETGKHGWVVSVDEVQLAYSTYMDSHNYTTSCDNDDAIANLNAILKIDPTLKDHPAFKWVNDKNTGKVKGWVLPAHNTLKIFGKLITNREKHSSFNKAIENCPIEKKNKLIDFFSGWNSHFYISSTVSDATGNVRTIRCNRFGYNDGTTKLQDGKHLVRAFYKF